MRYGQRRNAKERTRIIDPLWYGLLICLSGCLLSSCDRWSDKQIHETERRGDIVRSALEEYKRQIGTYPNNLEQLVPKYLERLPLPTVGEKKWSYEVFHTGQWYLIRVVIRSEREPLLQATADSAGWTFDTK
jgi:hypothetical protein